jgi:hypothetical protein
MLAHSEEIVGTANRFVGSDSGACGTEIGQKDGRPRGVRGRPEVHEAK